MKITVEATDLRDDKKYLATVESWETLETVRAILADKMPDAPAAKQHFYVQDQYMNVTIPADQLRKKSRAAGMLDDVDDESGNTKVARCFVYVNATPLDFSDMMMDEVINKLRTKRAGEVKQIMYRMQHRGVESKYCIAVDSASITVDEFKAILLKKLGPPSLTGLTADKLLLYEREVQPGRPLEGKDLQSLFGSKIKIDIEVFAVNDPVTLRVIVKKCLGLVIVEQHELSILDHLVVEDLKLRVCEVMKRSTNPSVSGAPVTPANIRMKVNGSSLSKKGSKKLVKKFGIPPEKLWLRAFGLKDKSPVIVYI